jgi:hypothetical protein
MTGIASIHGGELRLTEEQQIRKLNNEEFIAHLMMYSSYGPMAQIVIIEAIRFYTEKVVNAGAPSEDLKAYINPIAWYKTSEEIQNKFITRYGN